MTAINLDTATKEKLWVAKYPEYQTAMVSLELYIFERFR